MTASFYPVYSSFSNLIPFSLPTRPVSALDGLHLIKFCTFLSSFRMGLTNPGRALGRSSLLMISLKLSTVSGIPPFSTNSSRLAPSLLCCLNSIFLSDRRACVVYQNHKSHSFRVRRGVPQKSVLGLVLFLFSSMIFRLLCLLPSSALFTLTIWPFGPLPPSVPTAVETTQGALFRLECWSQYWCFPLNPSKCEASFFSVDPHQANLQPNLLLPGSRLRFNPTPAFLGIIFDRTLPFSKHVSSLKAKFFPLLKTLRCISASSWGSSKESFSVLYKAFFRAPSHLCFTRMVSFLKRYEYYQIGTPSPSGRSRHFRLPFVLSYPTSSLRDFFTFPTSHPDSFHSFIL